jgi:tetratricopeptide (TPR) repeat protein
MSDRAAADISPVRWQTPEPAVKLLPLAKFLPLLRAGVAAAPNRADLKLRLARTLFHTDRVAEVVDWLTPAIADEDVNPELLYYLGQSALATGDDQLALDALRSAAAKGFGRAFGYLAEALRRLDRRDEALEAGLQGLERLPSDFKALGIVARELLDRGETGRLWALCIDLRARGAWGTYIPSAMALAAVTPEQNDEVAALIDPPRWFSVTQLALPEGFNQRLAGELLEHKSPSPLSSTKATVGEGSRIDQLGLAGGTLSQDLLGRIRSAVEDYVAERQAIADHPMIAHRPASVALNSWALIVHRDGHETWHIHPDGWISGVYYVKVPEVEPSRSGHPGAIEFGLNPFGWKGEKLPLPHWHVMPQAGLLLLFPSYYAHRTWSTGVSDPRICVAFDVMPSVAQPEPL